MVGAMDDRGSGGLGEAPLYRLAILAGLGYAALGYFLGGGSFHGGGNVVNV